ncbi:hypothetical protein MYX82_12755 [Acidobacteria bacterium AH-259-D05]|nr:hypothetical protein [Acidobacteria bacterium AH-259-D05]
MDSLAKAVSGDIFSKLGRYPLTQSSFVPQGALSASYYTITMVTMEISYESISAVIRMIKNQLEKDVIFELQRFAVVKSENGVITKLQLSFQLYNNKKPYKVIRGIRLIFNDDLELKPIQQFRHSGLNAVAPNKPFYSFILGEGAVTELDLEFESESPLNIEENNNIKVEFLTADQREYKFEFGVVLEEETIDRIKSLEMVGKSVLFACDHLEIG